MATVRCILSISVANQWPLFQLDINNAFLHVMKRSICSLLKISMLQLALFADLGNLYTALRQWFSKLSNEPIHLSYPRFQPVDGSLFMTQSMFAHELLVDSGLIFLGTKAKGYLTALPLNLKLLPDEGDLLQDAEYYRSMVRKLNYLTNTRPDFSFVVQMLSQFMHHPRESHLQALTHIRNYVYNTVNQGIVIHDSKKVLAQAVAEVTWLVRLLDGLCVRDLRPVILHCDNNSALHIARNPVFHERTKKIDIDRHFTREKVLEGLIHLVHLPTSEQEADILTKILPSPQHSYLLSKLDVLPPRSPSLWKAVN
ncbi:hypothetical protein LIER_41853 [Lithospermum erythrorhizon]|uniref:Reverse transcriptase Ty1/copia-type domain-containing protein n=1 Tax=Lithospermum erythrorhizon TaxID=34254 RepID=A0AAV3RID5_LITER